MANDGNAGALIGKSGLDIIQLTVRALALPAAFYAVGYLIMHAYVSATQLQASFWFTESFYREAGAAFLIDILMSVALLPHVFIALSALLIALFPADAARAGRQLGFAGYHFRLRLLVDPVLRRRAFYLVVALGALLTIATLRDCELLGCRLHAMPRWLLVFWWVLGDDVFENWLVRKPDMLATALFFSVAIPTLVALGALAVRVAMPLFATNSNRSDADRAAGASTTSHEVHPFGALLLAGTFAVLTVFVPVGYGSQFYDFVAARLADESRCMDTRSTETQAPSATATGNSPAHFDCYLLGKFDTRYILIGRRITEVSTLPTLDRHRIYIKQVIGQDGLEPFAILAYASPQPVRGLIATEVK